MHPWRVLYSRTQSHNVAHGLLLLLLLLLMELLGLLLGLGLLELCWLWYCLLR